MGTDSEWVFPDDSPIAALAQAPKIRIAAGSGVWGPSDYARQFCVLMYEHRDRFAGKGILDVGTGSGVLAIFAAKLNSGSIVAIDTSDAAVQLTKANAARNAVADKIGAEAIGFKAFASRGSINADVFLCNHFSPVSVLNAADKAGLRASAPDMWPGTQRELLLDVLEAMAGIRDRPLTLFTHVSEEQGFKSTFRSILDFGFTYETLLTAPIKVNKESFKEYVDEWGRSGRARMQGDDIVRDVAFVCIENLNRFPQT